MPSIEKRISKQGIVSYRARVIRKGHRKRSATFTRKADALKWALQTEAEVQKRKFFADEEASRHTLSELIERYVVQILPGLSPPLRTNRRGHLNWWKEELGHFRLSEIRRMHLCECRDKLLNITTRRGKLPSPSTVNRILTSLSHAFSVAVEEWEWLSDNPMRRVRKLREPRGRVRFLSDEEKERLLEACRESKCECLYAVVVLALSTGMRRGEIMNLKWQDIDFKRGLMVLHKTKNNERRGVPLVGHAHELLEERRKESGLVFAGTNLEKPLDMEAAWQGALKRAEIKDFRFHDLRHSAASYLAMNGATATEIAEILGHKTLQMVKRYSHLSSEHLKGVMSGLDKRLFSSAEGDKFETT